MKHSYKIPQMSRKKQLTLKILFFLVCTDLLETLAQFCFKKTSFSANSLSIHNFSEVLIFVKAVLPSPFLWLALISVLTLFIIWTGILSKIDLSVAVPVASFSYIAVPVVSAVFLGEKISVLRWGGIFIILMGVVLVSMSASSREKTT